MFKSISTAAMAAIVVAGFSVASPVPADAASCTNSLNTCAARCRKDNPSDRNCVSDHCSPKFETCKSTGCWQQGGNYANKLTCNLDRK